MVLADIKTPYFSRTLEKYNGHLYAPYKSNIEDYPAVIKNNNILFFAHDLDRIYAQNGSRVHRQLFGNAMRVFHQNLFIETKGLPSAGRISLLHQKEKSRFVLHLLYAPPLERGRCLVIEDMPEIHNVEVSINLDKKINSAFIVNLDKKLDFKDNEKINIKIERFTMHEAIVLDY